MIWNHKFKFCNQRSSLMIKKLLSLAMLLFSQQSFALGIVQQLTNDYSSTNVTTSTFVEIGTTSNNVAAVSWIDNSGISMILGIGPTQAIQYQVPPGGFGSIPMVLIPNTPIYLKAIGSDATGGDLYITFFY